MEHWAEAFERRSVDDLLEHVQLIAEEEYERTGEPRDHATTILLSQLGKKLTEERERSAAVLDAALAWEKAWSTTFTFAYPLGFMDRDQVLIDAVRAYRATKETT